MREGRGEKKTTCTTNNANNIFTECKRQSETAATVAIEVEEKRNYCVGNKCSRHATFICYSREWQTFHYHPKFISRPPHLKPPHPKPSHPKPSDPITSHRASPRIEFTDLVRMRLANETRQKNRIIFAHTHSNYKSGRTLCRMGCPSEQIANKMITEQSDSFQCF